MNLEGDIVRKLQFRVITIPQDNRILKERKTRHECKRTTYLINIKCFRCGKKGHDAKSCHVVAN